MKNSDKPAFASTPINRVDATDNQLVMEYCHGLTKREYFAVKALQGMLNGTYLDDLNSRNDIDTHAKMAVCAADTLLIELEK